ncbi:molybdopterin-dependent oxidoreductase [Patulibacter sp. NPDC049589]|uniref:molybdopterin-dependent oxidoreductase n=1 Tax=Patulibacter sp. NPDC049589 TaxID=3154731 RepID=UPI003431DDBD
MRLVPETPPPGPARPEFWRSPVRGPWITAALGIVLLVGFPIVFVTGILSHAAYLPQLGDNDVLPRDLDFQFVKIDWPTSPVWLYAVNQGTHVTVGILLVPVVIGKLWSVIPKLFAWPPAPSPAEVLTKLANLLLVGSAFFQLATGIANIQLWYPWHFNFVVAHYYGGWVLIVSIVLHVAIRMPKVRAAMRTNQDLKPLRTNLQNTRPERYEAGGLVSPNPGPATISRRGVLGIVGAASGALLVTTVGQSVGGPLRRFAVLAPRGNGLALDGPNGFPINKTAQVARVTKELAGPSWVLELTADGRQLQLDRDYLLSKLPQHTYDLPIACVEGWSTTQSWTGVRLADLGRLVDADPGHVLHVGSLQPRGAFRQTTLSKDQANADKSLLALKVGGVDLSMDHGFPARIIVPAMPGVHCTKWVSDLQWAHA